MEKDELEIRLQTIEAGIEEIQVTLDKIERRLEREVMEVKDRVSTLEYYRRA